MLLRSAITKSSLALSLLGVTALFVPTVAHAQDHDIAIATTDTLSVYGDLRLAVADGERTWVEGGFGKLRHDGGAAGAPGTYRVTPELGEAGMVWQPRFGWSLSGTVVAIAQGGKNIEAGLSEAYLTFKPLSGGPVHFSARAGLMWPPVSLEHSGPEWAVTETITPSAINSWVGEEVKALGLEVNGKIEAGNHRLTATLALMDNNDTAGALLTFRGWALHDRKALAFRKQPLPTLNDVIQYGQPRFTHPVLDLDPGTLSRPGFYAKLAWDLPVPVHLEYFHYDNNGNPDAANASLEWGWRTRFDNIGMLAEPVANWQFRTQVLQGTTRMGPDDGGGAWIQARFRAAYGMVTRHSGNGAISARIDLFDVRNSGSVVLTDDDENGWAATLAARRNFGKAFSALAEFLHVDSRRDARLRDGLAPRQTQEQLQVALRAHW